MEALQQAFPEAPPEELKRFHLARKGNVRAAEKQYRACLEWRRKTLPLPLEKVKAALETRTFSLLPGRDITTGFPVLLFNGSKHDNERFTTEETLNMIIWVIEHAREISGEARFILMIFAPSGTPLDLQLIRRLSGCLGANYPESLERALVFPVGRYTPTLWSMCKLCLDPVTAAKVDLLAGGGRRPPRLEEYLRREDIPVQFRSKKEVPEQLEEKSPPEDVTQVALLPALNWTSGGAASPETETIKNGSKQERLREQRAPEGTKARRPGRRWGESLQSWFTFWLVMSCIYLIIIILSPLLNSVAVEFLILVLITALVDGVVVDSWPGGRESRQGDPGGVNTCVCILCNIMLASAVLLSVWHAHISSIDEGGKNVAEVLTSVRTNSIMALLVLQGAVLAVLHLVCHWRAAAAGAGSVDVDAR